MTGPAGAVSPMQSNRGSLCVELAELIWTNGYPDRQFVQRLSAPRCARRATAGSFVHVQCDRTIPMRRPLSIMRVSAEDGWLEILYKVVGDGLHALSRKRPGDRVSLIGPIGNGFSIQESRTRNILIGGGVGIPPVVFLAESLSRTSAATGPLVLMGSEIPFPFEVRESALPTEWLPGNVVTTMQLLESLNISCRLASLSGFAGCYPGYVTDLARRRLETQTRDQLAQTQLFACGPTPMLAAVAGLAREFDVPCQVSLEEYMACAVGGCAGCAVLVETDDGPAMKRVCVDGPVFDAARVFSA